MSSTRRAFLKSAALASGTLALGFRLRPPEQGRFEEESRELFRPNAWIAIDRSGLVTLTVGKSEMGQGVRTALPMILADELEVDLDRVRIVQAAPGPDYPDLETSGSRSLRSLWMPMREAGAAAREMLVAAAAARWRVPPEECRAEAGRVAHPASGRSAGFGSLAGDARKLPVPRAPVPKAIARLRIVGRPRRRIDGPRIVAGEALYSCDVRRPGMKFACMLRPPVLGASLRSWDGPARIAPDGVRAFPISAGLAVVANDTWSAFSARDALEAGVVWDEPPGSRISSAEMRARLEAAAGSGSPGRTLSSGDEIGAALARSASTRDAEYFHPFQTHAPLEPMNAVADVRSDARGRPVACEIWAGTQNPTLARDEAARLLGLDPSRVAVHVTLLGGGFGRRGRPDFVLEAVEVSKAAGAPVSLQWSRQDDTRHGWNHPVSLHRLRAGFDPEGRPAAWSHRVIGPSLSRYGGRPESEAQLRSDLRGAYDLPYAIPAISAELIEVDSPVRLGPWRGVQYNHNVFAAECFVDELAHAAGADPVSYRLGLLSSGGTLPGGREGLPVERTRLAAALTLAAEKSGWARPLPPDDSNSRRGNGRRGNGRRGRGVACAVNNGNTYVAAVAEVVADRSGGWRVERVVCAADCGIVVNPLGFAAQVEGSVVWAVSSLSSEITLSGGRVQQSSYRDFPVLRMGAMPRVEAHAIESREPPSGMGEPPVPVTLAAVGNALFAATGRRLREIPLRPAPSEAPSPSETPASNETEI